MGAKKSTVVETFGRVTVYQRRPSNFRVVFPDGAKRRERSFTTEAAATKFAAEKALEIQTGSAAPVAPEGLYGELVASAIARNRNPGWGERHARTVDALARNYLICAPLGTTRCDEITSEMLNDRLQWIVDEGYSRTTADHVRKVMRMAARRGVELGIWTEGTNPMQRVKTPKSDDVDDDPIQLHRITRVPTTEQVHALEVALERMTPASDGYSGGGLLVRFAAATGLRQGEQFALQRKHIDFDRLIVNVRRTAARSYGGAVHIKKPKTDSSKRSVPITVELADDLRALIGSADPDAVVFSPRRGEVWNRSYLNRLLKRAKTEYPYRWHDLRHYRATKLIEAGADPAAVAAFLGHSSPYVTMTMYVGTSPDAVNRLRNLI